MSNVFPVPTARFAMSKHRIISCSFKKPDRLLWLKLSLSDKPTTLASDQDDMTPANSYTESSKAATLVAQLVTLNYNLRQTSNGVCYGDTRNREKDKQPFRQEGSL